MACCTIESSSPLSSIAARPCCSTIRCGSPPPSTSASSTVLAADCETLFPSTMPTSWASAAGVTFDSEGSVSPMRFTSSLRTQLASVRGSAESAASASSK